MTTLEPTTPISIRERAMTISDLVFSHREQFRPVSLVALFVEPRIGSGERICGGVIGIQDGMVRYVVVPQLSWLVALYGAAHEELIKAATVALESLSNVLSQHPRRSFEETLRAWATPVQGTFLGKPVHTVSSSLDDALAVSLRQFSSLYSA